MAGGALALALAAAFLHAGWNVLLAGSRDTRSATGGLLAFGAAFLAVPAVLTGGVSAAAVPFVAGSTALEVLYFVLLARAYDGGELSVVYPIARGTAPALVLIASALALTEEVAVGAAAGVALIALGIVSVGWGALRARFATESAQPSAVAGSAKRDVLFGLAIGAVIASYTLVDSEAMEHARPIAYLALVVAPCALVYPLVTRTRPDLSPRTALTAAATFGAFLMVLAAFRLAPAAPVAAVRESSVVIAALLAAAVLREPVGARRIAGAVAVTAGVALIAYS